MTRKALSLALASALSFACTQNKPVPAETTPPPEAQAPSAGNAHHAAKPADVVDVTWEWVGLQTPVEKVTVDAPERYTVRFEASGRLILRADCNRGSGSYTFGADRRIAFGNIALTKVACPPGSLSDRFVRDLGRAAVYFLRDGELHLDLPVDSGTLRFRRAS